MKPFKNHITDHYRRPFPGFKIRILRYHVIIGLVGIFMFLSPAMFSGEEKTWYPYTAALTFDDGPHPRYTRALIHLLEKYHVRATFFLVGQQVRKYPDLVRELVKHGSEIGNHTYHHYNLTRISSGKIIDELEMTNTLIEEYGGVRTTYFRPPGGNYDKRVTGISEMLGYTMALWDVMPHDHIPQEPASIAQKILDNTSDGNIILLHSGIDPTLACLPGVIEQLHARGFRFVTVSEIMAIKAQVDGARF